MRDAAPQLLPLSGRRRLALACCFGLPMLGALVAALWPAVSVPRLGFIGFDLVEDWPMLLALGAAAWLLLRGLREVQADTTDVLLRNVRAGGAGLICAGELLAYSRALFEKDSRPGHLLAMVGAALVVAVCFALYKRRRWLARVEAGRVQDFAIRTLAMTDDSALRPYDLGDYRAPFRVLVWLPRQLTYRNDGAEVPVALVPSRPVRRQALASWIAVAAIVIFTALLLFANERSLFVVSVDSAVAHHDRWRRAGTLVVEGKIVPFSTQKTDGTCRLYFKLRDADQHRAGVDRQLLVSYAQCDLSEWYCDSPEMPLEVVAAGDITEIDGTPTLEARQLWYPTRAESNAQPTPCSEIRASSYCPRCGLF